jgi:AcrR family transcriptional regulator
MQRPDPLKRAQILATAARLFASKPFHEVKLDAIAAKARIGKGTLYIYFASKEDLYISLVTEALSRLVDEMRADLAVAAEGAGARLALVVGKLVDFAFAFPDLFELLRSGLHFSDRKLLDKRAELAHVVESVLRAGVRRGEIDDENPDLTAQYVLAFLRVAMVHRPAGTTARKLKDHMFQVLSRGVFRTQRSRPSKGARKKARR